MPTSQFFWDSAEPQPPKPVSVQKPEGMTAAHVRHPPGRIRPDFDRMQARKESADSQEMQMPSPQHLGGRPGVPANLAPIATRNDLFHTQTRLDKGTNVATTMPKPSL